eukprot:1158368-Pelagomonas_calceolata.AAC.1
MQDPLASGNGWQLAALVAPGEVRAAPAAGAPATATHPCLCNSLCKHDSAAFPCRMQHVSTLYLHCLWTLKALVGFSHFVAVSLKRHTCAGVHTFTSVEQASVGVDVAIMVGMSRRKYQIDAGCAFCVCTRLLKSGVPTENLVASLILLSRITNLPLMMQSLM